MSRLGINDLMHKWVNHVGLNYGAYVDAANTTRKASLVGLVAGPFTIAAGATFDWRLSPDKVNVATKSVALTSGSRTATQVAADINGHASPGITASVDAYERMVLTQDTDTSSGLSYLQVVEPSSGDCASTLGFYTGQTDVRVQLQDPGPRGFVFGEPSVLPDTYWHLGAINSVPVGGHRVSMDHMHFEALIRVASRHQWEDAIVEAVQSHLDILQDVMHAAPSCEGAFTYSVVESITHIPHVQQLVEQYEDGGGNLRGRVVATIAEARCRIRAELYQEWT